METGNICPAGKHAWPELVGQSGCHAKATIERENGNVTAVIISEGSPVPADFRCDRVWVVINLQGNVVSVPKIG